MKTRNGFVSNSSSTSFVVLLPKNFKLDIHSKKAQKIRKVLMSRIDPDDKDQLSDQALINGWDDFLVEGRLFREDSFVDVDFLREMLSEFIVAETKCEASDEELILIDSDKVRKILESK